jgi:hypothetical protein
MTKKKKLGIRLEITGGRAKNISPDYWGEVEIMQDNVKVGKVGFTISNEKIYVDDFNVDDKFQRTGYGSIMMDVIKGLSRFTKKPIHLYSIGYSLTFYAKMGFVSVLDPQMRERLCIKKGSSVKENDLIWIPENIQRKKLGIEI